MNAKTLIIYSAFMSLMASATTQADNNLAHIEQVGEDNNAWMMQKGSGLKAEIYQENDGNSARFQQLGSNNMIVGLDEGPALQSGDANWMFIDQEGVRNHAFVSQQGLENAMSLTQYGVNNITTVGQFGSYNTADVQQYGNDNAANLQQAGNANQATIIQMGEVAYSLVRRGITICLKSFSMQVTLPFNSGLHHEFIETSVGLIRSVAILTEPSVRLLYGLPRIYCWPA
ncbi:hypothetical protein P4544_00700 [Halomonas sp. LY9]